MLVDLHNKFRYSKSIQFLSFVFTLLSFLPGNMSKLSACSPYEVIVFDSYGTLVDVNDLKTTARNIINSSDPTAFINLWRNKQLDYTWLRSLMKSPMRDSYKNFWDVTRDALKYSLDKLEISLEQADQEELMNGWLKLSVFPDVRASLTQLKQKYKLAVLSNGTPTMLREVFKYNGLDDLINPADEISVDEVRMFKPHPTVYGLADKKLRVSKSKILFVSGNSWDVVGAKSYGFRTVWINRNNDVEANLGVSSDLKFSNLIELTKYLNESTSQKVEG